MDIRTNIPLSTYTTMKLGGPARFFVDIHDKNELPGLFSRAKEQSLPVNVLGGGSNLIVKDEGFAGIIAHIKIPGFEVTTEDTSSKTIRIGAGENWDEVVKRSVDLRLSGIEAMSGIPGSTGATPVQNVGAYGQEIADTLVSLEAFDTRTGQFITLSRTDCNFSYRNSIFRGEASGRYIITSVILRLSKNQPAPPFYGSLQTYLDENHINLYTQEVIREAVLAIRAEKLPSVQEKPSAGSFFKNAIIEDWLYKDLLGQYPDMPAFEMGGKQWKIPSGWLIEHAGLKGKEFHGFRVYEKNALVLVNESASTYSDLAQAREEIVRAVHSAFRIQLEQEPLELG
jgi:UDP-N-acetylmuramate dehydrogenase